ncbi:MAG: ABC transporter substrate-binding protein [Anaerolineales bacterium]|nr:ABC transporter substrate-binding protein [Anaerolineales bacterium]
MRSKLIPLYVLIIILSLTVIGLSACNTPEPEIQEVEKTVIVEKEVTRIVEGTPVVETVVETVVEVVTATPESEEAEPAPEEAEPSTLRIGVDSIWGTGNPLTDFSWGARPLIFARLTEIDGLTSVREGLAESWESNDDKTEWTFKIRDGISFHDGTPCTAEDIAWSLNFMLENAFPANDAYVSNFEKVEAVDDSTLVISLINPDPAVPEGKVIYAWILPRSIWDGLSYDEATGVPIEEIQVGTGAYKYVDYVEGEYLILEAFDGYWEGRPPIDRIVFKVYATQDAMVEALVNNEIDLIDAVPGQAIDRLEGEENVEVVTVPQLGTYYLMLNSYVNGTQPKSLFDPVIRKAIEYATDRQQIVNVGFFGRAEIGAIPAPTGFGDFHSPNIEPLPFDVAEGNRILDEAGYMDTDSDGIREWSDGSPIEYRMYTDEGATGMRMLEVVADGLAQIGIMGYPQEVDSIGALYPDYDFDLAIWSWGWDPDIDETLRSYTCAQVPDGWNDCGFCSEDYDALYEQQSDPTLTREERREIIWQMQEIFYEGRGYITWCYPLGIAAYRSDNFQNFITDRFDRLWELPSLLQAEAVQ